MRTDDVKEFALKYSDRKCNVGIGVYKCDVTIVGYYLEDSSGVGSVLLCLIDKYDKNLHRVFFKGNVLINERQDNIFMLNNHIMSPKEYYRWEIPAHIYPIKYTEPTKEEINYLIKKLELD